MKLTISDMPSPRGWPIIGDALDFLGDAMPWDVMLRYARDVGPVARVDLPGSPIVLVSDPAAITQIMVTETTNYYKKTPVAALRPVALEAADVMTQPGGKAWAERKAGNPMVIALRGNWLAEVAPTMQHDIANRIDSWIGETFDDAYNALLHMAFDTFSNMLFGRQFDAQTFQNWVAVAGNLDQRMKRKLPFMSGSLHRRGQIAQDDIQKKFVAAVQAARANPDKAGADLLRHTLRAGSRHDDSLLATELAIMYYGGVVSSSTVVAATLFLLSQSNLEKSKVLNALTALGADPSAAAIQDCKALQAAVLEAMRIFPPVSLWTRNVGKSHSVTLGNYELPADTAIFISNRFAHHDAAHWDDPETFTPDRWTAERRASDRLGSAMMFPFGRGERTCFAQEVGLAYIHLAVATILLRSDPQVGDGMRLQEDFWFATMVPKKLRARFMRRGSVPG